MSTENKSANDIRTSEFFCKQKFMRIISNISLLLCFVFLRLITGKDVGLGEAFTFTNGLRRIQNANQLPKLPFLPRGGSTKAGSSKFSSFDRKDLINGGNDTSSILGFNIAEDVIDSTPKTSPIYKHKPVPVEFVAECNLPTDIGQFRLRAYRMIDFDIDPKFPVGTEPCVIYSSQRPIFGYDSHEDDDSILRRPKGNAYRNTKSDAGIPLRIHDQCATGEVFRSQRCDCRDQLHDAMRYIHENGGCIIYLQQEGRGIGFANKIAAYALQDTGDFDTVDANLHLGFPEDNRSYGCVPHILEDLCIDKIRLLTNNPRKTRILRELGVNVADTIPIVENKFVNSWNRQYLLTKVKRMRHDNYQSILDDSINNKIREVFRSDDQNIYVEYKNDKNILVNEKNELNKEERGTQEKIVAASLEDGYCFGKSSVESAINAVQRGEMVVIVDDHDRENEGDLIMSGQLMTPNDMAFIVQHSSGVICVGIDNEWANALNLSPMVVNNEDPKCTAFTLSVDAKHSITTGISALDRCKTINLLSSSTSTSEDFVRPGHIFPLRAKKNGILSRNGHTEASVDLMKLAGLPEPHVGVLCEIVSEENPLEMARLPELQKFCEKHNLVLTSIADMIQYRKDTETS